MDLSQPEAPIPLNFLPLLSAAELQSPMQGQNAWVIFYDPLAPKPAKPTNLNPPDKRQREMKVAQGRTRNSKAAGSKNNQASREKAKKSVIQDLAALRRKMAENAKAKE